MAEMIDLYGGGVELYFYSGGKAYTVQDLLGGYAKGNIFSGVNFVSRVTVSIDLLRFTQIEVVLTPTFDESVKLIKTGKLGLGYSRPGRSGEAAAKGAGTAAGYISAFNMMGIRLHYGGQKTVLYKAILQQPEIEIGLDGISVTIKGIGLLFASTKKANTKSINNATGKQVLTQLTKDSKVKIIIDPKDSVAEKALSKTISLNPNSKSEMDEINKIVNMSGCRIVDSGVSSGINGDPQIKIASMDFLRKSGCQVTLAAFKNINPSKYVYPILELSTSISNYQMGLSLGLQGSAWDPENKDQVSESKSSVDAKAIGKNAQKVPSTDGTTSNSSSDPTQVGRTIVAPFRQGADYALDTMRGWMQTLTETSFQYDVTTVGFLSATPGRPVAIDVGGVSFLSGIYDCYNVTHEFSESGVETKFNLSRTFGLGSVLSNAVESMKDKTVRATGGKTSQPVDQAG